MLFITFLQFNTICCCQILIYNIFLPNIQIKGYFCLLVFFNDLKDNFVWFSFCCCCHSCITLEKLSTNRTYCKNDDTWTRCKFLAIHAHCLHSIQICFSFFQILNICIRFVLFSQKLNLDNFIYNFSISQIRNCNLAHLIRT